MARPAQRSERRRRLALDLPYPEPMAVARIRRLTDLAEQYAGKTSKTVTRDINELERLRLVGRSRRGTIRPTREIIQAFLPLRIRQRETLPLDTDS